MSEFDRQGARDGWERMVIENLARAALDEQRKSRRWGIFFKLLGFAYLFVILFMASGLLDGGGVENTGEHTALVELNGVISAEQQANADTVSKGLQDAFEDKGTRGVVLRVNSPGGSPVQSATINNEIQRLRKKYPKTPIYTVVEDVCASGGYYVAVATDRIYVQDASIVGSIGVVMNGFGFTGTMQKLGVERRLITAGDSKGFLDPFSPVNDSERAHAQKMLVEIHQQFIDAVRAGRGKRLKEEEKMFSGLVWTGRKSIDLGLADAMGSVAYVAREVIKADKIVDFTPRENFVERVANRFGAAVGVAMTRAIESSTSIH
ncbi:MAG: S49 family peptidase [Burkholderiales bacterium]